MNNLNKHIAQNEYSGIYLLYGEEEYLIRYYRDRLTNGILGGSPEGNINYHYYEGNSVTADDIIIQAQSLPFFADVVLIVVENSGLLKRTSDLSASLESIPPSTKIIFVEREIDKRNSLYKFIKSSGTIAELEHKNDKELINWVAGYLKREDCLITLRAAKLLIAKAGVDMQQLVNELDKLVAYVGEKKQIDIEQVEDIISTQLSNRIFVMIDNIVSGKCKEALNMYKDLLALKESPLAIMSLLTRHYNILLQLKELQGETDNNIAKRLGIPSFTVRKYKAQSGVYNKMQLKKIVLECVDTEEAVKTGTIGAQVGIEMLIIKFSRALK